MNTVPDNWYESFFHGLNCEMWEKAIPEDWTAKEVSFLIDVMQIKKGSHVLDIPCGFGRVAIPMAKEGYNITCVDISESFIKTLEQKLQKTSLPVRVIQGNILSINLSGSFDGAYCVGNSFGYFDYDGMEIFVKKVAALLKSGGRFIINSGMIAESILSKIPPGKTYIVEDLTMHVSNEYFVNDSYMVCHLNYRKGDQSEAHSFKHYVYTIGEIKRLLKHFGLYITAIYNSVDKTDYQYGDAQAYIVAEKRSSGINKETSVL